MQCWMWKSACVGVYQLLNWKILGETLKLASHLFLRVRFLKWTLLVHLVTSEPHYK